MGFNTTVVILNDALDNIAKDPEFGKRLVNAILSISVNKGETVDVSALNHVNAATVVETHHADFTTLVAVGGNYASVLGVNYWSGGHHKPEDQVKILKSVVDQFGYRLVKKNKKFKGQSHEGGYCS